MTLKDLERALDSLSGIMSNIDNFYLKNIFLYGKWLDYVLTHSVWKKSLAWVQARMKVGKRRAYSLQNLAKLGTIVPTILCCKRPVDFFIRNHRQL